MPKCSLPASLEKIVCTPPPASTNHPFCADAGSSDMHPSTMLIIVFLFIYTDRF